MPTPTTRLPRDQANPAFATRAALIRPAAHRASSRMMTPDPQPTSTSFFFWDGDDNCWEILTNPEGGYSWLFELGDQQGRSSRPQLQTTGRQYLNIVAERS